MPSGPTHLKFNLALLLPVCLLIFYQTNRITFLVIFALSFLYSTCLASPDMDLAHQIKLFSWKGLLTLPFRFFYAPLVKHRSKISHSLLLGTPGRLLSLAAFVLCITFIILLVEELSSGSIGKNEIVGVSESAVFGSKLALQKLLNAAFTYKTETVFALAGFLMADLGHLFLDRFF